MNPLFVVSVLAGIVAIATALGFLLRFQQGRVHHTNGHTVIRAGELPELSTLGAGATLLQFSTEVCSPCAVTRRVLGGVADDRADVTHVDLDLTHRPDLASKFNIMQTPTTFILDSSGIVRARIGGAPKPADVRAELDRILALA
jgi:thiol-disulfide isomerase/thioredoxin